MPTQKELRAEGRERKIARRRARWLYEWNAREHLAHMRVVRVRQWRQRNEATSRLWSQVQKSNWKARRRGDPNQLTYADWSAVIAICGGKCLACGADGPVTIDHVVPTASGGLNHPANLQPLCGPCNLAKSDNLDLDYRNAEQRRRIGERFQAIIPKPKPKRRRRKLVATA